MKHFTLCTTSNPQSRIVHHLPLLMLCGCCLGYYTHYFNYFFVPASDFLAFRASALHYLRLSLPDSFQRMPVYPLMVAIVSCFAPGDQPELLAAELINIFFSLSVLLLLYKVSTFYVGKGAFFVVWLFALNSDTLYLTTQPLLEVVLVTFILLTIYLGVSNSRWAYAAAFVASVTRYEAIFLLPGLCIKDYLREKKLIPVLMRSFAASSGFIVWMILSIIHSEKVNPYIDYVLAHGIGGLVFLKYCVYSLLDWIPSLSNGSWWYCLPFIGTALLFCIIGAYSLIQGEQTVSLPLFFFFAGSMIVHYLRPFEGTRFLFPQVWILYLVAVRGIQVCTGFYWWRTLTTILLRNSWLHYLWWGGGMATVVLVVLNLSTFRSGAGNGWFSVAFTLVGLLPIIMDSVQEQRIQGTRLLTMLLVGTVIAVGSITAAALKMEEARYHTAEFKYLGEWYATRVTPHDTMAVSAPPLVKYYSKLPSKHFIGLDQLKEGSFELFIRELKEKGITYIAWDTSWFKNYPVAVHQDMLHEAPKYFTCIHYIRVRLQMIKVYRVHI